MIGSTISRYRIVEKLGEGGMGVVYKAEDTTLERMVALKFLAQHLLNDEEAKARFLREAKAAAALDHPNICTVYEIAEVDGKTFIAMAFLEGESLEEHIAKGPLSLRDALDIARQTVDGLQAAHGKGVLHRDVKPANIIISPEGRATILDFGLARLTEASRLTKLDTAMGTVAYMSPEQAQGMEVDSRTDIWALGCVLYEMVSGQRPFQGQYDQALLYEIVHEEPAALTGLRTGVPVDLEFIVTKCLAKASGERYQSAAEVLVDLSTQQKRIESGQSAVLKTAVGQATLPPRPAPKIRRTTAVLLAVFAALILLAAAFVAGTIFSGAAPTFPTYTRLTFRPGTITSARFAPDGNTVVYSAAWEGGRRELFTTRPGSSESRSLGIQDVDILAISKTGEMALALRPPLYLSSSLGDPSSFNPATLLQASLSGGAPREVLRDVLFADFAPDGQMGVARVIDRRVRIELPVGKVLYETPNKIASFRISPRDGQIAFSERPLAFGGEWQMATVNRDGGKIDLGKHDSGDSLNLVWSPDGDAIWYDEGWMGGDTIRALTLSGTESVVQRGPVALRLLDLSEDGRALASRVHWRVVINCLAPGQNAESDLSWFDASELADITSDGETILMTEFGEGGGLGSWGVYLRKGIIYIDRQPPMPECRAVATGKCPQRHGPRDPEAFPNAL